MSTQAAILEPFADLEPSAASHFKLYFYAAVSQVLGGLELALGSEAERHFPFLSGYRNELHRVGAPIGSVGRAWWVQTLQHWERKTSMHLPLRALNTQAGLDFETLCLLIAAGLPEEDARFGQLFEGLTPGGQQRPTLGLLGSWWAQTLEQPRTVLRQLLELGALEVVNPDAPRAQWTVQVPAALWDVLRGETPEVIGPGLCYHAPERLQTLQELILPASLRSGLEAVIPLLADAVRTVIVRGPENNGRTAVLGGLARAFGCGMLEVRVMPEHAHDPNKRGRNLDWIGALCTALPAMPALHFEVGPGQTATLPEMKALSGPLGVTLGRHGGLNGPGSERAVHFTLDLPTAEERGQHWLRALTPTNQTGPDQMGSDQADLGQVTRAAPQLEAIRERYRLGRSQIHRVARLAQTQAAIAGRENINLNDVRTAARSLGRQTLETLANPVQPGGQWTQLAIAGQTLHELHHLEARCRHRERLHETVGVALAGSLGTGVRALFTGPSGTGKTLAARLLGESLGMDVYRVDLANVINKYIGETEKNLEHLFSKAEDLDVILLLDEGDSLLGARTNVSNANDRYANLETNFLLQRLEAFDGILIVTTNASDRIDQAFQRRMDVVIEFRVPDALERQTIWRLHLPEQHHLTDPFLNEVASRCNLTGGQIRNAALHAALLCLESGGQMRDAHLEAAARREYRKLGAICPLRSNATQTTERPA
jgi:ATPase family associated with various cellular activities (AAA)